MSVTPDPTIGAHVSVPALRGSAENTPDPSAVPPVPDQNADKGDGARPTAAPPSAGVVLTTDPEAQTDDPLINPNNS